jgi:hypothetical protein
MLCTRTDPQAYRTFERAAAAVGLRLTDWVRDRLKSAAGRDLAA